MCSESSFRFNAAKEVMQVLPRDRAARHTAGLGLLKYVSQNRTFLSRWLRTGWQHVFRNRFHDWHSHGITELFIGLGI